ncbi:MAG: thiol oxidoreductase, partial [Burkholderiales bacterium]|nr:thiol oxidoreductase [Burkholderiales bacterium]
MRLFSLAALLLAPLGLLALQADGDDTRPGDGGTVLASGRQAFSFPFEGLSQEDNARFAIGNSFFKRNWVQAPASTTARDGLGPHFMARSCGGCHVADGRGTPPLAPVVSAAQQPISLLFKLGVGDGPEPRYGDQLLLASIEGVPPEGELRMAYRALNGRFADGTRWSLREPRYRFVKLSNGALHLQVHISPRLAPQLPGVGLIEAVADADIEANALEQAARSDAIKGRVNRVTDPWDGQQRVGRFGWKGDAATLVHQSAAAFNGDIGITSRLFPQESCMPSQIACLAAGKSQQRPEVDDKTLADVAFYQALLAVPARPTPSLEVLRGRALFHQAQCAACHRPSYTTGKPPFLPLSSPRVAGQRIWPYSDFLLHDMGERLADGGAAHARARLWKTPPLWGLSRVREVGAPL